MDMGPPVHPKVVLVTGASAGIGEAIARRFARNGSRVVAAARRIERLESLARELGRDRVLPVQLDVCDSLATARIADDLPTQFKEIDCLINNAGLALGLGAAAGADLGEWDRMIDTNCRGLVHVTRAVLPGMLARKRGHVINLGSVAGAYPYPGGNVYGATKAFVRQFSLNLRCDVHGTGIRVTCIEPGICGGTEFSEIRFNGDMRRAAAVCENMQPLSAEDIAEAAVWAASLPSHVNVNRLELMPVAQSFAAFAVQRG